MKSNKQGDTKQVDNKQVKNKGPKEGYCNICGQHSQLTQDHIPPQSVIPAIPLKLRTLAQKLGTLPQFDTEVNEKSVFSQNGLWMRSLCGNCNNNLLGAKYDRELSAVSKQVASLLRAQQELGLHLPEPIKLKNVKPQRLIRAVIGHILAGRSPTLEQPRTSAPFAKALRNYFLDTSSNIADEIEVYYWIYPNEEIVVINGLMMFSGEGVISGSCLLKFYPLAFWIVWDRPSSILINAQKISKEKLRSLDESCEIEVYLRNFPPLNYPEVPEQSKYFTIYHNDSTVLGEPKERK